jgi:hypothetical protein
MVCGSSEFMGVPWESVIKERHRQLDKAEHGTLRKYADGFISWLEQERALFPELLVSESKRYFRP